MTSTDLRHSSVQQLSRGIQGSVLTPDHPDYPEAALGWNLAIQHRPAVIVRARHRCDVVAAVRYARSAGLGVGVMATGHGAVVPCDGLLIDTSALRGVRVAPRSRRVRVAAGTRWQEVIDAVTSFGLAGLPGSSPNTGVVGYTLGGGFGWLGRKFGLASQHITQAEVVTAEGRFVHVSPYHEREVFWALGGGTGNFGIVTALEFTAHPVDRVYAGNLYYPLDRWVDVATYFANWAPKLPDSVTAALAVRFFPATAPVDERLRGRRVVALRAVVCPNSAAADALVTRAIAELGQPLVNTFAAMSPAVLGRVSADPVSALPVRSHAELIDDLDGELIGRLRPLLGSETEGALAMLEFRTLGGALRGRPDQLSPMARTTARYSFNALGLAPTPTAAESLETVFAALAQSVRPHATGHSYVNFLDSRMARPERVRAAYSADDWARLIAVKQRLDPEGLFRFNRNISVGS